MKWKNRIIISGFSFLGIIGFLSSIDDKSRFIDVLDKLGSYAAGCAAIYAVILALEWRKQVIYTRCIELIDDLVSELNELGVKLENYSDNYSDTKTLEISLGKYELIKKHKEEIDKIKQSTNTVQNITKTLSCLTGKKFEKHDYLIEKVNEHCAIVKNLLVISKMYMVNPQTEQTQQAPNREAVLQACGSYRKVVSIKVEEQIKELNSSFA